jgi:hypothetical protein
MACPAAEQAENRGEDVYRLQAHQANLCVRAHSVESKGQQDLERGEIGTQRFWAQRDIQRASGRRW